MGDIEQFVNKIIGGDAQSVLSGLPEKWAKSFNWHMGVGGRVRRLERRLRKQEEARRVRLYNSHGKEVRAELIQPPTDSDNGLAVLADGTEHVVSNKHIFFFQEDDGRNAVDDMLYLYENIRILAFEDI